MTSPNSSIEQTSKRRLVLAVLILCSFLIFTFSVVLSTLLVDVAASFKIPIGTMSQLSSVGRFVGLVTGFALSFLVIRLKLKPLFISGVTFFAIGILGASFAPNFLSMLIFEAIMSMGGGIVGVLTITLIGEFFPLKERGWAIGLTTASAFVAYIILPPVSSSLADIGSWRSSLLWLIFPISLACLVSSWLIIPSKQEKQESIAKPQYREAFKEILTNKSAFACVSSYALLQIISLVPLYAVSFYRISFVEPRTTAALFSTIAAVGGAFGAIVGGALVNRFGRKSLSVTTGFVAGVFAVIFSLLSNVLASVACWTICAATLAMADSATGSLSLEQVPKFRGSVMSIRNMFRSIGLIIGIAVSGVLLNLYPNHFQLLMIIYGACGIASVPILLLAKDPCKT